MLLLAVGQNPFVVVRVFGDIPQHIHGFPLVRHIRLFHQTGQTLPRNGTITTGDDAVRERNTSAHVTLHCRTAFFRQPSVDSGRPFRRSRTAEGHLDQIEFPVIFNILQKRYDFRQTLGVIYIGCVQRTLTDTEIYTDFLPAFLSEKMNAPEQSEYQYYKTFCPHFNSLFYPPLTKRGIKRIMY